MASLAVGMLSALHTDHINRARHELRDLATPAVMCTLKVLLTLRALVAPTKS